MKTTKKLIAALTAVMLAAAAMPLTAFAEWIGDADEDGILDPRDVALVEAYLAGEAELSEHAFSLCDADGDGEISQEDLEWIRALVEDQRISTWSEDAVVTTVVDPEDYSPWITDAEGNQYPRGTNASISSTLQIVEYPQQEFQYGTPFNADGLKVYLINQRTYNTITYDVSDYLDIYTNYDAGTPGTYTVKVSTEYSAYEAHTDAVLTYEVTVAEPDVTKITETEPEFTGTELTGTTVTYLPEETTTTVTTATFYAGTTETTATDDYTGTVTTANYDIEIDMYVDQTMPVSCTLPYQDGTWDTSYQPEYEVSGDAVIVEEMGLEYDATYGYPYYLLNVHAVQIGTAEMKLYSDNDVCTFCFAVIGEMPTTASTTGTTATTGGGTGTVVDPVTGTNNEDPIFTGSTTAFSGMSTTTTTTTIVTTMTSNILTTKTTSFTDGTAGDADEDGEFTISDLVTVAKAIAGVEGCALSAAGSRNVDCDGITGVDNGDLKIMLQVMANLRNF